EFPCFWWSRRCHRLCQSLTDVQGRCHRPRQAVLPLQSGDWGGATAISVQGRCYRPR
ncbi:unnamed protein product, partial [Musa textilis]